MPNWQTQKMGLTQQQRCSRQTHSPKAFDILHKLWSGTDKVQLLQNEKL